MKCGRLNDQYFSHALGEIDKALGSRVLFSTRMFHQMMLSLNYPSKHGRFLEVAYCNGKYLASELASLSQSKEQKHSSMRDAEPASIPALTGKESA